MRETRKLTDGNFPGSCGITLKMTGADSAKILAPSITVASFLDL
jgi:hypothetical protein